MGGSKLATPVYQIRRKALLKPMAYKIISRRRFIENSVSGGLPVGLGFGVGSLGATPAAIPGTDQLSFKIVGYAPHGFAVAILRNPPPPPPHHHARKSP